MAPCVSTLSPAAPAYIPQQRGMPWMPPPPPSVPCLPTYVYMAPPPPPPPEFLPWPPVAPPPPPPCSSCVPQFACAVPGPGMHGAAALHGGVLPVPHGAMAMAATSGPAPCARRPRCHVKVSAGRRRAAGPAARAASGGLKKAAAVDAKEAATNQPSPRSVLAVAAPSPPISPTTSLPTSFPYQYVLPAPPPASAGVASAAAPSPADADGSMAVRPPQRRERRLRGPRRARPVQVRRAVKPRRLFDQTSQRTSLMIRNIPNDFTRMRLINILDEHCFIENQKIAPGGVRSGYDFFYLPIDFRTRANKGYAFVNMTSPEAARRLWVHLHMYRWAFKGTAKTCVVDYAYLEGHDELVAHFSGSRFDCPTEEFLPLRFEPPRDGARPAECAIHVVGRLSGRCQRARGGK